MKKVFLALICVFFAGVKVVYALPTCMPQDAGATFVSRWQKESDAWRLSFTCENGQSAKIYAEDVDDPSEMFAAFLVVDQQGMLESQDIFDSPCDAIAAYCSGRINILPPEVKQALLEHLNNETP